VSQARRITAEKGPIECLRRLVSVTRSTLHHLLRELRRSRSPVGPLNALRIVAVTHCPEVQLALRMAAFREEWQLQFAFSQSDVTALLGDFAVHAVVYDHDFREVDWRTLCHQSVDRGIGFYLVAGAPTDQLFLSVMSAGGLGVLRKPVTMEEFISSMHFARSLAEWQTPARELATNTAK